MIGKIKKVGNDIMFHAINHANVHDVIALLQDNEVDVNCTNINGQTPLHYAVKSENSVIIDILLQYQADPNVQELEEVGENSPMHLAAEKGLITTIEQFMICGGDPTIKNKCGFTCMHIAARNGHTDLVKLLLTKMDPEARDSFGFSASYWAHQNGHSEISAILPPPLKVTKEEYYEHIKQVWATTGFKPGGKKGKGKKKKKKK